MLNAFSRDIRSIRAQEKIGVHSGPPLLAEHFSLKSDPYLYGPIVASNRDVVQSSSIYKYAPWHSSSGRPRKSLVADVMSSLSSSFSESNSSDVEGFFFRPGTSRTSKKIRSASWGGLGVT